MNALVAQFPETATAGPIAREGGLIHRLDNGTSGALLIARTQKSFHKMRGDLRAGKIGRTYEALVTGNIRSRLELGSPIAHHPVNASKMTLGEQESTHRKRAGRAALTIVEPVRTIGSKSLVRVMPRTGSRHQIRVHLASAGYPIVGDVLYGGPAVASLPEGRFWLHLKELEFESATGERVRIHAPVPAELSNLIRGERISRTNSAGIRF